MARARLAVWKFASCDGCQLSLLDCEDELLAVADAVDIVNFPEASSRVEPGPYDLSRSWRGRSRRPTTRSVFRRCAWSRKVLVTIGACATAGGLQALRNGRDHAAMLAAVYARPEYIASLDTSTPIARTSRSTTSCAGARSTRRSSWR